MLYLFLLLLLPYFGFIFFGESFNPVSKPQEVSARSRWRRGRKVGTALFTIAATFILLKIIFS